MQLGLRPDIKVPESGSNLGKMLSGKVRKMLAETPGSRAAFLQYHVISRQVLYRNSRSINQPRYRTVFGLLLRTELSPNFKIRGHAFDVKLGEGTNGCHSARIRLDTSIWRSWQDKTTLQESRIMC